MLLWNLLNEASMAVVLDILFPLLFLLLLPLVMPHIILPVLLPLLGLVHHLPPLALQLFCRELPTSDKKKKKIIGSHSVWVVINTILWRTDHYLKNRLP